MESKKTIQKNQWKQDLDPWRDKQDSQIFNQTCQEKKDKTQICKIRNERGKVTSDTINTRDCKKIL